MRHAPASVAHFEKSHSGNGGSDGIAIIDGLREELEQITSSRDLERWVRVSLRRHLPHAAALMTFGKTYASGTVPTHKIGVDYPLSLVEDVKNASGALDDPLMREWLRTGTCTCVRTNAPRLDGSLWERAMAEHGIRSLLIHGHLDSATKRFAIFQFANAGSTPGVDGIALLERLSAPIARTGWAIIDRRGARVSAQKVGHPTATLTSTEVEIHGYLTQGCSNKEIARLRGVSDSTIKTQIAKIGAKLGASRRSEIVAIGLSILSTLPAAGIAGIDN